jgi:drug/metabolite transporter (DMT)-like permease
VKADKHPLILIALSAVLFGISPPLAKLLVRDIPPVPLAGFLYLGAFLGLSLYAAFRSTIFVNHATAAKLKKRDIPWLAGAILSGGIIAPISLMFGLKLISGFTASLLLNLEGVATAVIAVCCFKEDAGRRLWLALFCMTAAGVFLTWDPSRGEFNLAGSLLVALAMLCWGIDNNLTRNISTRDSVQIARTKGLVSGCVSLLLAYALGLQVPWNLMSLLALLLGAGSYGISLVLFIRALAGLGSFRAGVFFSLAPFVGAGVSLLVLREWIGWVMFPATMLMAAGVWLIATEEHGHHHVHAEMTHTHLHEHKDVHHEHEHSGSERDTHSHRHRHYEQTHSHTHWPDTHHRHG